MKSHLYRLFSGGNEWYMFFLHTTVFITSLLDHLSVDAPLTLIVGMGASWGGQSINEASPFLPLMSVSFSLKPCKVSLCFHSSVFLIVHLTDYVSFSSNIFMWTVSFKPDIPYSMRSLAEHNRSLDLYFIPLMSK